MLSAPYRRLNSKLKVREVEIADLIVDLSDGVSLCPGPPLHLSFFPLTPAPRLTRICSALFTD